MYLKSRHGAVGLEPIYNEYSFSIFALQVVQSISYPTPNPYTTNRKQCPIAEEINS